MMTPGHAARMASTISAASSGSQLGKWPMPEDCERKWKCIIEAPASKASCAERAICVGETGTIGCWRGSVRTPFRAQVKIALDIGGLIQFLDFEEKCGVRDLPTLTNAHARHTAGVDSYNAGFHLHSFDQCEGLP